MDRGGARPAILDVRDDHAVEGDRATEVQGPIDRIDDPQAFGFPERGLWTLLGQNRYVGIVRGESRHDRLLGCVIRGRREVGSTLLACDDAHVRLHDRLADLDRGFRGDTREGLVPGRIRRAAGAASCHCGQSVRTRLSSSLRSNGFVRTEVIFRRLNSRSNCGRLALTNSTGMSRIVASSRTRS